MGYVSVDQLKQGMVLSEDVRDIASKLLLSKGQTITSQQIRILKIWGVIEVNVTENHGSEKISEPGMDSELIEEINENTKQTFKQLDLSHPAINEIFRSSVWYRSQYKIINPDEELNLTECGDTGHHLIKDIRIKIDKSEIKLPEIPTKINELSEIIDDPFASASDIAKVVNKSPSLTALLLRIVNSAFYGFPAKIDSISRAVTLIGSREVTGLALGISTMKLFKDIPKEIIDMHSFLKHSLACGIISRILAAHKNLPQTEQLFVSGLLHDIGRLIFFKYFPDQAKALLKHAKGANKPLFQIESNQLGYSHAYIGKYLLQKWKLHLHWPTMYFFTTTLQMLMTLSKPPLFI